MSSNFTVKRSESISTSLTSVGGYTVAANTGAIVVGLTISNTSTEQVFTNVVINNGTNNYYIVKNAIIPAAGTLVAVGNGQKIILQTGDSVQVNSDLDFSIDAMLSIMESTDVGMSYNGADTSSWDYANVTISTNAFSYDSMTSVIFDGNKFIAIPGNGSGYPSNIGAYSTNGIDWTTMSLVPMNNGRYDIAYGNGIYVIPHYDGRNVATSADGITWTNHANAIPDSGGVYGTSVTTVAFGNGKFVALDSQYPVSYISTDGENWSIGASISGGGTAGNLLNNTFNNNLQFGNGTFVAAASSSYDGTFHNFVYSTDGITWGNAAVSCPGSTWELGYGNGTWVALPVTGSTSLATGMISTDNGQSWSNISLPNPGQQFASVIHDGERFLGIPLNTNSVYSNGNAIISTDGTTWSNIAFPEGNNVGGTYNKTAAYGNGRLVVASFDITGGNIRVVRSQ